jgi:hypothetical protein
MRRILLLHHQNRFLVLGIALSAKELHNADVVTLVADCLQRRKRLPEGSSVSARTRMLHQHQGETANTCEAHVSKERLVMGVPQRLGQAHGPVAL